MSFSRHEFPPRTWNNGMVEYSIIPLFQHSNCERSELTCHAISRTDEGGYGLTLHQILVVLAIFDDMKCIILYHHLRYLGP